MNPIEGRSKLASRRVVGLYFYYRTAYGVVSIVHRGARWHVMFQDADLGSYISAHQAADDVAGGHTFTPPSGSDLGSLGISKDLDRWEYGERGRSIVLRQNITPEL
jgi:hypothetical protein